MRFATLLWHGDRPIGICLFISPPLSLAQRNRYFGHSGKWSRESIRAMNSQLVMLSRVVLHPTYRAAGIASRFVRRSCELCPYTWIETLTEMGRFNPFFEQAGFVRVGSTAVKVRSRAAHSKLYGGLKHHGRKGLVTEETFRKSEFASPIYYIFDNRQQQAPGSPTQGAEEQA